MAAQSAAGPAKTARPSGVMAASLLAFTAGFVDTAGFIALFGLFTAHVTGNFVLIGASIVSYQAGLIGKLAALPVFILVVAVTRLYVLQRERIGRNAAMPLLAGQMVFLLSFMTAGIAATPLTEDTPVAIAAGLLGVTAMAIQNVASRTVFAGHAPTTVMTGNVTQVVMDLVDLTAGSAAPGAARSRLAKMWPPVAAFTVGALAAALGYKFLGFWCLAAPIAAVGAVLALDRRT